MMSSPYVSDPGGAFAIAQAALGATCGAVALVHVKPRLAGLFFALAVGCATLDSVAAPWLLLHGFHHVPLHAGERLWVASLLMGFGALLTRRVLVMVTALVLGIALRFASKYFTDFDFELTSLHAMAVAGVLALTVARSPQVNAYRQKASLFATSYLADDMFSFVLPTCVAIVVSVLVHRRLTMSGDEWAYTFQAAVFAKGRAYGQVPDCYASLRAYWVFAHEGRLFAQYTPGWPYFMAPFVLLRMPWMAGPFALGLLALGAAHCSRRAVRGYGRTAIRVAGHAGALSATLGAGLMLNAGSRFPHVFVAALFVWGLLALLRVADGDRTVWPLALGCIVAWLPATRPSDGLALCVGLAGYYLIALFSGRVTFRQVLLTAFSFAGVACLTLVILRLQIGVWFRTGYWLSESLYGYRMGAMSVPKPHQFKWGMPLGAGAYNWWPAAPAIGVMGLVWMRKSARAMRWILITSGLSLVAFYTMIEAGRGSDRGFGPRYVLPVIVPMALGGGVFFGRLTEFLRRASTRWPSSVALGLAVTSALVGTCLLARRIYPEGRADVMLNNHLPLALHASDLHRAVVVAGYGVNFTDLMDLPENYPLDLYPNPDRVIATDRGPLELKCLRDRFPTYKFYRAVPSEPVTFAPID